MYSETHSNPEHWVTEVRDEALLFYAALGGDWPPIRGHTSISQIAAAVRGTPSQAWKLISKLTIYGNEKCPLGLSGSDCIWVEWPDITCEMTSYIIYL